MRLGLVVVFMVSALGSVLVGLKTAKSNSAKWGRVLGAIIAVIILIGVIFLWKLVDRWWNQYWDSFRCKKCRKLYDDRWQTEWGICWYCKNGKTVKVEIKRPKPEPRVVKLFTCPECQLVLKTDMKDSNGKCRICNNL